MEFTYNMKIRDWGNGVTYNGQFVEIKRLAPKYKKRPEAKTTALPCIYGVTYRKQLTGDYYSV